MSSKIGENIRIVKGFSQEWLANKLGKSQNWIQKVEKGEIDISIKNLEELSVELGVTLEYLITFQPSQIFNNCAQCGVFNNCNINSDKILLDILNVVTKISKS